MPDPDWARDVVYGVDGPQEMERALADAAGADVIIKTSGVGIFDEALEEGVLALKRPDNLVLFWDVDAPATLDEMAQDPNHPFRQRVPRFDLVCTYGGGRPVVDGYLALGARQCVPIYNALDTQTHFPVPVDPRFQADLGFLGNRLPDREARVDAFFFHAAAAAPQQRFLLGGSGWDDRERPDNVDYVGHVYTRDHNAFNCTPRAVLNISRESMARYGYSPATRVFEAAGAGACLITDHWRGVELFLEPGREVLVARDGDEVAAHLEALSPERARAIGQAALRRVIAEHTYAHRAAQLDSLLDGRNPARARTVAAA
jgi:spore maturation protein CgeB